VGVRRWGDRQVLRDGGWECDHFDAFTLVARYSFTSRGLRWVWASICLFDAGYIPCTAGISVRWGWVRITESPAGSDWSVVAALPVVVSDEFVPVAAGRSSSGSSGFRQWMIVYKILSTALYVGIATITQN
jgi:hypothetical protein